VATMLSARALRTGQPVTPALFEPLRRCGGRRRLPPPKRWSRTLHSTASSQQGQNIVAASRLLIEHHGGRCRPRMGRPAGASLCGPETANVVLAMAFGSTRRSPGGSVRRACAAGGGARAGRAVGAAGWAGGGGWVGVALFEPPSAAAEQTGLACSKQSEAAPHRTGADEAAAPQPEWENFSHPDVFHAPRRLQRPATALRRLPLATSCPSHPKHAAR